MDNTRAGKTSCWELISPSLFLPVSPFEAQQHNLLKKRKRGICSTDSQLEVYDMSVTYRFKQHCFLLWLMFLWTHRVRLPVWVGWTVCEKTQHFNLVKLMYRQQGPGPLLQAALAWSQAVDEWWVLWISVIISPYLTWPHERPKRMWVDGWQGGKSTCSAAALHQ